MLLSIFASREERPAPRCFRLGFGLEGAIKQLDMEQEKQALFGIPENLATKYGISLTGKWIHNSKVSLYAYKHITSTTVDRPTEYVNQEEVSVHHLQPEFIFEDPILRSLVAEANSIFVALQEYKKRGSKNDYVKISRTYRSIIRACLEKLQEATSNAESEEEKTKYQNFVTIFYSVECVWHLTEILFIDTTSANTVVPLLLEWNRFHFPAAERMATDLLLQGRESNENENYWPAVKGLVLQGQISVARIILQLHSLSESTAFKMADQILMSMPTYNVYSGVSIQKFRSQWQYWLTDTERKLSAGILATEPQLEEIIQLITGNTTVWNEQIKLSECWYEYLPGFLFYTDPACKHFELGTLAKCWLNRWANIKDYTHSNFMKHLDRVILNLMENDMHKVLNAIQQMCDNQWFATHLTDLLYQCGQLEVIGEHKLSDTAKLRESMLFEFGSSLMSRNSLWVLGLDYLDHCCVEGRGAMEMLLTRIPTKNEKQALKLIDIARKKGLSSAEQEICKVQAKRSMENQRYGNALEWAIRSKDSIYVTSITDFFLNHYSKTGEMLCEDILANIGAKMFVSPRLVFLVKYFHFYQFYRQRDFVPAAELLVGLLDSNITPEYFWPSLLIDSIPLLESKDLKIPTKGTNVILHHLESDLVPIIEKRKKYLEKNPEAPVNILKDYRIENIDEIVNLLRLACARNISRSIIIENTLAG